VPPGIIQNQINPGGAGTACTCLKIMPDTEIIEKTSQFQGDFRMVNQESG
jgi:hypothetical protein